MAQEYVPLSHEVAGVVGLRRQVQWVKYLKTQHLLRRRWQSDTYIPTTVDYWLTYFCVAGTEL